MAKCVPVSEKAHAVIIKAQAEQALVTGERPNIQETIDKLLNIKKDKK